METPDVEAQCKLRARRPRGVRRLTLGQEVPGLGEAWDAFTPFMACTPAVRKLLYTTNSIESLNYQLRKVTKTRGPAGRRATVGR